MVFHEQKGYAHVMDREGKPLKYPQEVTINHPDDGVAYPAGLYTVADGSFYIDEYKKLQIGGLKLVPIGTGAAAAKGS